MVGSIEEDKNGNLWLGTNVGLVKLGAQMKSNEPVVRVYTEADGLQGNFFIAQSACSREGELFFGGYKGYNSFIPEDMEDIQGAVCRRSTRRTVKRSDLSGRCCLSNSRNGISTGYRKQ